MDENPFKPRYILQAWHPSTTGFLVPGNTGVLWRDDVHLDIVCTGGNSRLSVDLDLPDQGDIVRLLDTPVLILQGVAEVHTVDIQPANGVRGFLPLSFYFQFHIAIIKKGRELLPPRSYRTSLLGDGHTGGKGLDLVVQSSNHTGAGLSGDLDHTRGLLHVLGGTLPEVLNGEHVISLGHVDLVLGVILVGPDGTTIDITTLTEGEVLQISQSIRTGDGSGDGGGAGGVESGNGADGILTPDNVVDIGAVDVESDGESVRLVAHLTASPTLSGGNQHDGGGISHVTAGSRSLGDLGGGATLHHIDLEGDFGSLGHNGKDSRGHSLVEGGSGRGVGGVTNHGGGDGQRITLVIGDDLMQGDAQIDGLTHQVGEGDGIGINRNLVGDQLSSEVCGLGLLHADDVLRVDEIRTGNKPIRILVLEERLTSFGRTQSDITVGIDIGVDSLGNIEVPSLISVEINHNYLILNVNYAIAKLPWPF